MDAWPGCLWRMAASGQASAPAYDRFVRDLPVGRWWQTDPLGTTGFDPKPTVANVRFAAVGYGELQHSVQNGPGAEGVSNV